MSQTSELNIDLRQMIIAIETAVSLVGMNDTNHGKRVGYIAAQLGNELVHQPSYIGGSARLWHFTSRHGSRAMVTPLIRAITPRWDATDSPEGLPCQLPCLRCTFYEGSNHSLQSAPYHEIWQGN